MGLTSTPQQSCGAIGGIIWGCILWSAAVARSGRWSSKGTWGNAFLRDLYLGCFSGRAAQERELKSKEYRGQPLRAKDSCMFRTPLHLYVLL